ncbi:TPA: bacteriocin immunity protein [Streptococcus suis]
METILNTQLLSVQELAILKHTQTALQHDEYLLKVIAYLKEELSPLAISNSLTPEVSELFLEINRQHPATRAAAIWNFLVPKIK